MQIALYLVLGLTTAATIIRCDRFSSPRRESDADSKGSTVFNKVQDDTESRDVMIATFLQMEESPAYHRKSKRDWKFGVPSCPDATHAAWTRWKNDLLSRYPAGFPQLQSFVVNSNQFYVAVDSCRQNCWCDSNRQIVHNPTLDNRRKFCGVAGERTEKCKMLGCYCQEETGGTKDAFS